MWIIVKIVWPLGWGKWYDLAIYVNDGTTRLIQACKNKNGIKIFRDVAIGSITKCDAHTSQISIKTLKKVKA